MRELTLLVTCLGIVSLSSADYYLVEPTGEMRRVEKTERGWESFNSEPSRAEGLNSGFIDTIFWHETEAGGWYYPNRDSNTVVLQYFNSEYACSLIEMGISYYSPGWADFYVWEGPNPLPATTSELEAHFYSTWQYDDSASNWVTMPPILFQGTIGSDDPPDDLVSRIAWVDIDPNLDIGTDYVLVGYRILTHTNPDGEPYGGKPWPASDQWYDPLGRGPHWTPCRSWMFRVQETSPLHLTWTGYGDITGDWETYYVIDIYKNAPPTVKTYTEVLGSYDLSARSISAKIVDFGIPAESSGVDRAWLFYYLNDDLGTLDSVPMTLVRGSITDGFWEAAIPGQAADTKITYYFGMSNMQGLHRSTQGDAWFYYLGKGHRGHILFYIGSEVDYGPHDPVGAVRSQIDVWDEGEKGVADSTVFEYYNTVGEKGIVWLDSKGTRLAEDRRYIRRFIDAGGRLLLSSQDWAVELGFGEPYSMNWPHWTVDSLSNRFAYGYLQLRSGWEDWEAIDTLSTFAAHGIPGDPITGSIGQIFVTPVMNRTGIFDSVSAGSNEIFRGPNSEILGFRYEGTHKLIFLYWHFHEIGTGAGKQFEPDTASQNEFMRNALTWLGLTVDVSETTADVSRPYFLSQNTPNPVSEGRTTILYSLPRRGRVSLVVYDIAGRRVKELVGGIRESGLHEAVWNGYDDFGREVSQGVYFYRLSAGDFTSTKKMIWLR